MKKSVGIILSFFLITLLVGSFVGAQVAVPTSVGRNLPTGVQLPPGAINPPTAGEETEEILSCRDAKSGLQHCSIEGHRSFWTTKDVIVTKNGEGITLKSSEGKEFTVVYDYGYQKTINPEEGKHLVEETEFRLSVGLMKGWAKKIASRRFEFKTPTAQAAVRGTGEDLGENLILDTNEISKLKMLWLIITGKLPPRASGVLTPTSVAAVRGTGEDLTKDAVIGKEK